MALTEELRMSILQFALQGKITEQFIADSSVDKLFETIQEKKNAMISAGVIKKEKKLPPLDDDVLFDIPQSWRWARMQYFLDVRDGTHDSPKYYAQGVPFVTSKNISNGYLDFTDVNYISQADADKINQRSLVEDNDILLAMIGSIGNPVKVHKDREFAIKNMALIKAVPQSNINMDYVLILLRYMQAIMKRDSSGGVQKFVSLSYLREFPVPIPPIEEQQRIVDRVNVLMSKLDEFSEIEQQLIALKANFPADLRGAILQAAMQGKLTEQLESDTPVEQLLTSIENGREQLLSKGAYKQDKKLRPLYDSEIPFDIPDSWSWVKLGYCSTYGQTKQKATIDEIKSDIWSLDLEDIEKTTGRLLCKHKASQRKINGDKVKFFKGNILYSKLRPYLLKILIANDDGICTPELIPFDMIGDINPRYILWVLRSPHVDYKINAVTYGVKMPRVGTDTMVNLLIPLPPIEEQQRIVERLDALLSLCDTLV